MLVVRIPYQSGNGFVERVLDGKVVSIILTHIDGAGESFVLRPVEMETQGVVATINVEAKAALSV